MTKPTPPTTALKALTMAIAALLFLLLPAFADGHVRTFQLTDDDGNVVGSGSVEEGEAEVELLRGYSGFATVTIDGTAYDATVNGGVITLTVDGAFVELGEFLEDGDGEVEVTESDEIEGGAMGGMDGDDSDGGDDMDGSDDGEDGDGMDDSDDGDGSDDGDDGMDGDDSDGGDDGSDDSAGGSDDGDDSDDGGDDSDGGSDDGDDSDDGSDDGEDGDDSED